MICVADELKKIQEIYGLWENIAGRTIRTGYESKIRVESSGKRSYEV